MKSFNTAAVCVPSKHYMVDITKKVDEIRKMVDDGKYFTISRPRQYGKTTTLNQLKRVLDKDYTVLSLDFQSIDNDAFANGAFFSQAMARIVLDAYEFENVLIPEDTVDALKELNASEQDKVKMDDLFRIFKRWLTKSETSVVLIIDEVDSATNNQVFLDFLSQLRDGYISRDTKGIKTFQSVILAGVTDVKHLKSKIREDSNSKENSPWNIAADFTIDMSLSEEGIRAMLDEYEADHHTGMKPDVIAREIRDYTNGYPFLVSRICQIIDEHFVPEKFSSLSEAWTPDGVAQAAKAIISEDNTLFDSIMGKIRNMPGLRDELRQILMTGETIAHRPDDDDQKQLRMYGFIINDHNTVAVANKIFEMRLYNYFIGESRFSEEMRGDALDHKPEFIKNGELNVPLIMERFIETQKYIRNLNDEQAEKKFIEEEGREKFLTYLSPIINGVGTFSIEEQTRNRKRMDIVIHYNGKRYIIELKIWHGERYNEEGEKQVLGYLDYFGLSTGYMLSFNFNKNKKTGVEEIHIGDKLLFEGIV
ncbi:AAA-like domain-containing protein [Butyrivibrio sp. YAB3001]|uniref:AAA-like domain-containing protein n=1 Tax=Butyrivibrio sp. YAB3001 TaxID=1520812 RepID=UPI0008F63B38|nr:AAA family ATPase [Butyrivibrio sp. YAB3001]SFB71684.1 PD-(D/E)XK nuclease superfamily protein [Butyrivibrio sp. YAB3001]